MTNRSATFQLSTISQKLTKPNITQNVKVKYPVLGEHQMEVSLHAIVARRAANAA